MDKNITPSEIIDAMGGTSEVAALCDIGLSAVSQWRTSRIPKAQMNFLRLAQPEIFNRLESSTPSTPHEAKEKA